MNFKNIFKGRSFFMRQFSQHVILLMIFSLILGSGALAYITERTKTQTEENFELMARQLTVQTEVLISRLGNLQNFYFVNDEDLKLTLTLYEISLRHLAEDIGSKIVLFDRTGKIRIFYDPEDPSDKRYFLNADTASSMTSELMQFTDLNGFFDSPHYVHLTEIPDNYSNNPSYIMVAMPTHEFQKNTEYMQNILVLIIGISILISFFSTLITTSKTTAEIQEIQTLSRKYSRGDLSERLLRSEWDSIEIEELALNLNKMAEFLSTSEERRDMFISNISHEIKTPLTTIAGFTDGILDGTISKDDEPKCLNIIGSEVKRLSRLTNKMLNTAKLTSENFKIYKEPFDFSQLLYEVLFSFEAKINAKNINMLINIEDNIQVLSDRDNMHQVLFNLIDNATKYINDGGDMEITLFYHKSIKKASFVIANTGEEIPPEKIDKICDRFMKVDESRSTDVKSLGLGLFIVKRILSLHDADLNFTSVDGITKFTFNI